MVGAEALVRWYRSDQQVWSARDVLRAAAAGGRGHALDKLVVDQVIGLVGTVVGMVSDSEPYLGANISPALLAQRSFLPRVVDHLQACGLDPSGLVLEARDHARILMDPVAKSTVRGLQDLGILLCLDDAGPGGGALATVRHLDLDVIKVSRRLIARSHVPAVAESIGNLVEQAHRHGTRTIGVGAAGERDAQHLAKLGFNLLQGHHFGRPFTSDDFLDHLDDDHRRARINRSYARPSQR